MLRGTTPTYYFAFPVSLKTIKEFKIIFSQDENSLVKTDRDCLVDETQNIVIAKLSQEETLSFSENIYAKIQAKALTKDGNVIASDILFDKICPSTAKSLISHLTKQTAVSLLILAI